MISYEKILDAMQQRYWEETGFHAQDASDVGIRLKVLATQLAALNARVEEVKAQSFPQTAGGTALERHAQTRGLQRKDAVGAFGTLRFFRETPAPAAIAIPAGVLCAVGGAEHGGQEAALRYETTAAATLAAGALYAEAPARAVGGGGNSNAAPGAISVMITPVQSVAGVKNPAAFTGGMNAESDQQLRARLLGSFASISNGTNAAFYYDFAMGFEGIASAKVVPRLHGSGTVGVYVAGVGVPAPAELVQQIKTQLSAAKEINVEVTVESAVAVPVAVTLELAGKNGVAFEVLKVQAEEKLREFFAGLAVGQSLLCSGIADALYHTGGVYNYKLALPAQDLQARPNELFTLGAVSISNMAVVV